ncbi:MAG TPA: RNA-binding protein [Anaerolineae bacterium]|jgi:RNA recognition motif-containing protein
MQGNKLYVGNLNYAVTNEQLSELFAGYGQVVSVNIIEGKGFGFVEMASQAEAEEAKTALHNSEFAGRSLKVDEARPPRKREDRGGGGGGGGGPRGRDRGRGDRRF